MVFKNWLAGAILVALGVAAALWWSQRDDGQAPVYRTVSVERGRIEAAIASSGTVTPVRQVQVGTQVSGQIIELLADFNTEVRKGQLIARIDPANFDNKVRQARADLDVSRAAVLTARASEAAAQALVSRARLELANAERDVARKKELLAQSFISQAEFDTTSNSAGTLREALKATLAQVDVARAQVESAQAGVKQREAALAQTMVDREHTEIRSPVDGVVIKRSVDVGQTVASSLQAPELFIIARDLNDMQVDVAIDEADVGRLRNGQRASFTVDAFPGRVYEGKVTQIRKAAVSLQNVVTYTAVVAFSNHGEQLLPGMTANARIVTDVREAVLKVPNAALRVRLAAGGGASSASGGGQAVAAPSHPRGTSGSAGGASALDEGRVYVLDGKGEPEAVAVELGASDGMVTEVKRGLQEGARVVTAVVVAPASSRSGGPRMSF